MSVCLAIPFDPAPSKPVGIESVQGASRQSAKSFGYGEGTALGPRGPADWHDLARRRDEFSLAFYDAWMEAIDLAKQDEMEPPTAPMWMKAFRMTGSFAGLIDTPDIVPLQLGGVSVSWHSDGLNIEGRFRPGCEAVVIVEDRLNQVDSYFDYDPDGSVLANALQWLAHRRGLRV